MGRSASPTACQLRGLVRSLYFLSEPLLSPLERDSHTSLRFIGELDQIGRGSACGGQNTDPGTEKLQE